MQRVKSRSKKSIYQLKDISFETIDLKLSEKSSLKMCNDVIEFSQEEFDDFLGLRPKENHEIKMFGSLVKVPRGQQFYGEGSYKYSGTVNTGIKEIPVLIQKCIDVANEMYPEHVWNGALANWYNDGTEYISHHSDDERDLTKGAPILSFSFGSTRMFRISPKPYKDALVALDVPTLHNSVMIMEGNFQKEFEHEILKAKKKEVFGPRVNITIRHMSNV